MANRRNKMAKKISVNDAVKMIKDSNGKFFTTSFVKRSNNEVRTMNCRVGVHRDVKGSKRKIKNNGLITVYDMTKRGYRNINVSGMRSLSINGKNYEVV